MLKRVEKRIRKKEKEAELGLDGDMKEMLGMNDTDSDESSASSDSEDSAGEEERGPPAPEDEDVSDAEEDVDEDVEEEEDGEESEEDEDEEDEGPSMNVSEALRDPLYLISTEPEVKGCILCPGKLLKNTTMIEVHLQSGVSALPFLMPPSCPIPDPLREYRHTRVTSRISASLQWSSTRTQTYETLCAPSS